MITLVAEKLKTLELEDNTECKMERCETVLQKLDEKGKFFNVLRKRMTSGWDVC